MRQFTYSSRYSPIRSNGPSLSQASTLHAVLSSAPGNVTGERQPSELTNRFNVCEMFVPLLSRLLRTSAPSFKYESCPQILVLNSVGSSRPTYMKLLLSLTVVLRPFPLKIPA